MTEVSYFSSWFYFVIGIIFLYLVNSGNCPKNMLRNGQIAFCIIYVFAILRYDFGNDYPRYWASIEGNSYSDSHVKDIELFSNAIISFVRIFKFPPLLFIIYSTICLFSYRYVIRQYSTQHALSWFFYFTFPLFFFQDCSTLRQSGAMAMFFLAFSFVDNGKWIKGLLCLLFAVFFHNSALICLLVLFLPLYKRISRKWNLFIFVASFVGGKFVENIVSNYITNSMG